MSAQRQQKADPSSSVERERGVRESVLTSVDDGIHLQDGDVSFVEGDFVACAAATCWLVLLHFGILCKTIRAGCIIYIQQTLLSRATHNGAYTHSHTDDHARRQPAGRERHSARTSRGLNQQPSGYESKHSTS